MNQMEMNQSFLALLVFNFKSLEQPQQRNIIHWEALEDRSSIIFDVFDSFHKRFVDIFSDWELPVFIFISRQDRHRQTIRNYEYFTSHTMIVFVNEWYFVVVARGGTSLIETNDIVGSKVLKIRKFPNL